MAIRPPFHHSSLYDPVEAHRLITELLTMLQADITNDSKELWLKSWKEYNDVGEWDMVFGAICEVLYIEHVSINERIYQQLRRIGEALTSFPPEHWEKLRQFVTTTAA